MSTTRGRNMEEISVKGPGGLTAFVPDGESRTETAILLVGTAKEYGISQRSIQAASGGFFISDELADLLTAEDKPEEEPKPTKTEPAKKGSSKKTSGDRAEKTSTNDKE